MISRRKFISLSAIGAAGIAGSKILKGNPQEDSTVIKNTIPPDTVLLDRAETKVILPACLKEGSRVAITAPASPTSMGELASCLKLMKSMGCKVEVGESVKNWEHKSRYFSESDELRAEEFMGYITREDIDAIICGRGGYGAMRLLPLLDFKTIQENPKIIIGFSDITALINAIQVKTGIITFHGPTASSIFNEFNTAYFKKILAPGKEFKPVKITNSDIEIINKGIAEGPLVGGNLSILAGTLGTPYEIDTRGAILFMEETREQPYKIDRMLTQLWLAGKLQQANGIIFGKFTNLDANKHFFPGMSFTVRQILEDRIKPLQVPAIHSAPFGHEKYNATLPISVMAILDADHKQIIINSPAVSI